MLICNHMPGSYIFRRELGEFPLVLRIIRKCRRNPDDISFLLVARGSG